MKTTRRGFFAVLCAFALALWKDPEKLFRKPAPPPPFPELLVSPRAAPGRIDFISLKYWWRIEMKPSDYDDLASQYLLKYGQPRGAPSFE